MVVQINWRYTIAELYEKYEWQTPEMQAFHKKEGFKVGDRVRMTGSFRKGDQGIIQWRKESFYIVAIDGVSYGVYGTEMEPIALQALTQRWPQFSISARGRFIEEKLTIGYGDWCKDYKSRRWVCRKCKHLDRCKP